MDISRLIPFIKKAVELTVSPEEVAAQMQKEEQAKGQDRERETIDNEIIEQDEQAADDEKNDEGALLETGFKELAVEDAIEKAKEEKKLESPANLADNNKIAAAAEPMTPIPGAGKKRIVPLNRKQTYWDLLQSKVK